MFANNLDSFLLLIKKLIKKIFPNIHYLIARIKMKKGSIFILNLLFLMIKMKVKYRFFIKNYDDNVIDVVIPTVSKDFKLLNLVLESLGYISNKINKIYIVAPSDNSIIEFCQKKSCVFINENSVLGYSKNKINYYNNNLDRSGWFFQQLLKLSATNFVEMENYFVIDSDTILINKTNLFIKNKFILFENMDWHQPYDDIYKKVFNSKYKNYSSFVSHMMLFNVDILNEIKNNIEKKYNEKWDSVLISLINQNESSCFSEYTLYGTYLLENYNHLTKIVPFYNKSLSRIDISCLENLNKKYSKKYNSLSFHSYNQL